MMIALHWGRVSQTCSVYSVLNHSHFFHSTPRPKEIHKSLVYNVVRFKQFNKYLCPNKLVIV